MKIEDVINEWGRNAAANNLPQLVDCIPAKLSTDQVELRDLLADVFALAVSHLSIQLMEDDANAEKILDFLNCSAELEPN